MTSMNKENLAAFNSSVENTLDEIAKAAMKPGETQQQAFARLLATDESFQGIMNNQLQVGHGATDVPDETALAKRADAENQLGALAQDYAKRHGVNYPQAYDRVLRTPEGGALYTKYVKE